MRPGTQNAAALAEAREQQRELQRKLAAALESVAALKQVVGVALARHLQLQLRLCSILGQALQKRSGAGARSLRRRARRRRRHRRARGLQLLATSS